MQLVEALIEHNKDFDLVIMPNQNLASTSSHPYYIRKIGIILYNIFWKLNHQKILGLKKCRSILLK